MTVTACPRRASSIPSPTNGWTSPCEPRGMSRTFTDLLLTHTDRLAHDVPQRLGGALGLGLRHIQMRAGANLLRPGGMHENALFLQARRDVLGVAELRIDAEPDEIRVNLGRLQREAWDIGDRLGQDLGVAMIVGETFDVMV